MPQQQKQGFNVGKTFKKGWTWTKIALFTVIGIIVAYVIYCIIVTIIRFLDPLFKLLKSMMGPGPAADPGNTGAPWWAWFGMVYLLLGGTAGMSALWKKLRFETGLSNKELCKRYGMTEADVKKLREENPGKSEKQYEAKLRENINRQRAKEKRSEANEKRSAAQSTTDATQKARLEAEADALDKDAKENDKNADEAREEAGF